MSPPSGSTGDASGGVARRRDGEEPTVRVEERDGFAGCVEPCFDGVAGETIRPSVALVGPPDEEAGVGGACEDGEAYHRERKQR